MELSKKAIIQKGIKRNMGLTPEEKDRKSNLERLIKAWEKSLESKDNKDHDLARKISEAKQELEKLQ